MRWLTWLLPLVLSLSCSQALPSATQYPAPLGSAAQPAVVARGDVAYARRGLEAIRTALRQMEPDELASLVKDGLKLTEAGVAGGCAQAEDGSLVAVVCHFGPSAAQPVAQGIFWRTDDHWEAQLYPQAALGEAAERQGLLSPWGCRLGCFSGITEARLTNGPDGRELMVVVDLGFTTGQKAEEAQALRLRDGRWDLLWVPPAGDWNYGHARVELGARTAGGFVVRSSSWLRQDLYTGYFREPEAGEHRRFTERWMRKGSAYVMADRAEEPTPYSALVKLVYYLSTGADEKAAALIARDLPLEDVHRALAQKPKKQEWSVTRWGEHGFLIDTRDEGKPALGVRFTRDDDRWVLTELWRPPG